MESAVDITYMYCNRRVTGQQSQKNNIQHNDCCETNTFGFVKGNDVNFCVSSVSSILL